MKKYILIGIAAIALLTTATVYALSNDDNSNKLNDTVSYNYYSNNKEECPYCYESTENNPTGCKGDCVKQQNENCPCRNQANKTKCNGNCQKERKEGCPHRNQ